MYSPGEIKGFSLESCYLRPSFNLFMNVMQSLGSDLPRQECLGPRSQIVRLFWVFTCIWQKDVAKIFKDSWAPRNVNPAQAITWLASATVISLYHFSITIYLYLTSFLATKYFKKNSLRKILNLK